jgi:hypothetical protein
MLQNPVKIAHPDRLDDILCCSEFACPLPVVLLFGPAKDHYADRMGKRLSAHPFQNFEPVHQGHLQIQEYGFWKTLLFGIESALQKLHRIRAVDDMLKSASNFRLLQRAPKKESVIVGIFD